MEIKDIAEKMLEGKWDLQAEPPKHCGECNAFLWEDIDGYGNCAINNERVQHCSDKCYFKKEK